MIVPDYVTRIVHPNEYSFVSLNELSLEEANRIKRTHCKKINTGDFYAESNYLLQRKEIEKWIFKEMKRKDGNAQNTVPVYMILGAPQDGEFDIRIDIQKNGIEYRIEINELNVSTISFTYPDSMYELIYDQNGNITDGIRTNTPRVYLYDELEQLIIEKKCLIHTFIISKYRYGIKSDYKIYRMEKNMQ